MNNLEHIPMEKVVSPHGETYLSFRKKLLPKYGVVWKDIFLGYLFIIVSLYFFIYIEGKFDNQILLVILTPITAFFIAFWIAYIQLFVHEAAHYNIHSNKKTNDLLATLFLCLFTGIDIKTYRKTHWKHHQRLGYTDDTEHSYFNGLTYIFLLKMISGLHLLNVLRNRQLSAKTQFISLSNKKQEIALLRALLLHIFILTLLFINNYIFTAFVWIAAFIVFYPFFATIRQLLEHRNEKASKNENFFEVNHGKLSRLFKDSLFAHFFGGAGFSKHLIHHWDPFISYTRLAKIEKFLEKTDEYGEIIKKSRTTYLKVFFMLLK